MGGTIGAGANGSPPPGRAGAGPGKAGGAMGCPPPGTGIAPGCGFAGIAVPGKAGDGIAPGIGANGEGAATSPPAGAVVERSKGAISGAPSGFEGSAGAKGSTSGISGRGGPVGVASSAEPNGGKVLVVGETAGVAGPRRFSSGANAGSGRSAAKT